MPVPHLRHGGRCNAPTPLVWCGLAGLVVLVLAFLASTASSRQIRDPSPIGQGAGGIVDLIESKRTEHFKVIDGRWFKPMLDVAKTKERSRKIFDLTPDPEGDTLQRFFNVWHKGSFAPPHKHTFPETFMVLEGTLAFFTFSDEGEVLSCDLLGPGVNAKKGVLNSQLGADVSIGFWHTMTPFSAHAVVWETNAQIGGYRGPENAKIFPEWAPREGSPEVPGYLSKLLGHCSE